MKQQEKAVKETPIFRGQQEYGVTDWERCLKENLVGTLRSWYIENFLIFILLYY